MGRDSGDAGRRGRSELTVIFDATALLLLVAPKAATPKDSKGNPIKYAKQRIDGEVDTLGRAKTKIIIPTPALSEALVRAGQAAATEYVRLISKSARFRIESFDERAALELALMTKQAIDKGQKRSGSDQTWAKVKFDRQIIAIAKVNKAAVIYTDDKNLRAFAYANGLRAVSVAELPVPQKHAQMDMLEPKDDEDPSPA